MKSCSRPNPVILAISNEITQIFASFSLKITNNSENHNSQNLPFTQLVTREIKFTLDSRKNLSRIITTSIGH